MNWNGGNHQRMISNPMSHDPEKLYSYLKQTRELYGNTIYLDNHYTVSSIEAQSRLTDYYREICDCQRCDLGKTRSKFVFGVGNPNADLVFVGEAPGEQEDIAGEPFVGRAGKLLDKITINLKSGSLLFMLGNTQHHWQHSLPKRMKISERRINLTFRKIL